LDHVTDPPSFTWTVFLDSPEDEIEIVSSPCAGTTDARTNDTASDANTIRRIRPPLAGGEV
jgi:hypothetical protein